MMYQKESNQMVKREHITIKDIRNKKYCYTVFEIASSKEKEHTKLIEEYNNLGNDLYLTSNIATCDLSKQDLNVHDILKIMGYSREYIYCPLVEELKRENGFNL